MERLLPGMTVQHFKGENLNRSGDNKSYLYKIIGIAQHTETKENLVVYQALYAPYAMFVRSYSMFMEEVDKKKYPNVKQKFRFEEYKS